MGARARAFFVVCAVSCGDASAPDTSSHIVRLPEPKFATSSDPVEPIPTELHLDPNKVALGRRLFADVRLSGSSDRACVDCHDLNAGGVVPGERRSNHPLNATGPYNVPTVLNVAFNFRLNWNGKFSTLEDHLQGPMMNPEVMNAGNWADVVDRVRADYDQAFREAGYAHGVTETSLRSALATYQRSLITPNSRFDRFLRAEIRLEPDEKQGYELFKSIGCISCHQGMNVGGNLFQRFGVFEDAFQGRPPRRTDYGRKLVTGKEEDAYVFRVPSLRNVALTAPYFHDGSAETLEEAVNHMARVQLGYTLSAEEVAQITAFLRTLTGELDGTPLSSESRK